MVEAGGIEPPTAGPKKAEKDPNNPEKPDRVRSIKRTPRNS
jgi:hypothetical protein